MINQATIKKLLKIPKRLSNVVPNYVMGIIGSLGKLSLQSISMAHGLNPSQYSRLLLDHSDLALENLNRAARRRIRSMVKKRKSLVKDGAWSVAIIIDATLFERSSRHIENAQRFNHGGGFILGHQWTNIVIVINGQLIPLRPIPFNTTRYCKKIGVKYETEHERVINYLNSCEWSDLLPGVSPREIVVLMDSGYDNKKLQSTILEKGWGFVASIKKSRSVSSETQQGQGVAELFRNTRKIGPWKTIRLNGGKRRREFRVRELRCYLKGLFSPVAIVSSEKPNKERIYLACSDTSLAAREVCAIYRMRWKVEIFHRELKSYLGFEDAGFKSFTSVESHVYWVYCAYILLQGNTGEGQKITQSVLCKKREVARDLNLNFLREIRKLNSRINSKPQIDRYCTSVFEKLNAA